MTILQIRRAGRAAVMIAAGELTQNLPHGGSGRPAQAAPSGTVIP